MKQGVLFSSNTFFCYESVSFVLLWPQFMSDEAYQITKFHNRKNNTPFFFLPSENLGNWAIFHPFSFFSTTTRHQVVLNWPFQKLGHVYSSTRQFIDKNSMISKECDLREEKRLKSWCHKLSNMVGIWKMAFRIIGLELGFDKVPLDFKNGHERDNKPI